MSAKWGGDGPTDPLVHICSSESRAAGRKREQKRNENETGDEEQKGRGIHHICDRAQDQREKAAVLRDEIAFTKRSVALINVACHGFAYP